MKRRARVGDFIDRHATILTIIVMAVLVLVPTKIAYDASGNATDAGETATHAAHKASHAVIRLENERRARIYDQNGIDHYFCGKSVAIEKILSLLLRASLAARAPTELTGAQLRARSVFEQVQDELADAPQCEVLIPRPPKPLKGESRRSQEQAETRAEKHPAQTAPLSEPNSDESGSTGAPTSPQATPPKSSPPQHHEQGHSGSGGAGGHEHASGGETPTTEEAAPQDSPEASAPSAAETPDRSEAETPVETSEPPVASPTTSALGEATGQVGAVVGDTIEALCTAADRLLALCH